MKTFDQGRPAVSNCFLVCESLEQPTTAIGEVVNCRNPRTGTETRGVVIDHWTMEWERPMNGLFLLNYGRPAAEVRRALTERNKHFAHPEVRLLLIQETV